MVLIRNLCHLCENTHRYAKYVTFNANTRRYYSNNNNESQKLDLPPLMKIVPHGLPNIFRSIKNNFLINFVIKPIIDKDFSSSSFIEGAKQALQMVSTHLANDNIEAIETLVTPEAYFEIAQNYKLFTPQQKKELHVSMEDIIYTFLYNINVRREDDKFTVEILVVFDCCRDFKNLLMEESKNKGVFSGFDKYLDRKYSCNYGFIRNYVKDRESDDWIINKLLHMKDKDFLKWRF